MRPRPQATWGVPPAWLSTMAQVSRSTDVGGAPPPLGHLDRTGVAAVA